MHPYHKPQRTTDLVLQPSLTSDENSNREIARWLENYRREREEKTPGKESSPANLGRVDENVLEVKRPRTKRGLAEELEQQENSPTKRMKINQNFVAASQQPLYSPAINLLPSFVASGPMNSAKFPLALMNNHCSLLAERLKISPTRKTSALSDITRSANVQNELQSDAARNALSVLLAAAANRENLPSTSKSKPEKSPEKPPLEEHKPTVEKRFGLERTPPQSPLKSLKPKKRWIKTVFQEEDKKARSPIARRITHDDPEDEDAPRSSSPSQADDDSLAMPIRWSEADDVSLQQRPLFKNSTPERRSPLSLQIASTLIAMSSDDGNSEPADSEAPLNLSTK